jgi:tRNA-dihydrouridine synthase A
VDRVESYAFVRDFVGTVAEAGCEVFIVHARNAWLQGLSPKENREIPPLRYEIVHRLKRELPHLTIVINGGLKDDEAIAAQLEGLDGVMIGREAYHNPYAMADWDRRFFGDERSVPDRSEVEAAMVAYCEHQRAQHGVPWPHIVRHMLGLYNGLPGARKWRQVWSDHRLKARPAAEVMVRAREAMAASASA